MLLGVNVPNFGPGTDSGLLREWANVVEGLGYDLLVISDHVVITEDVAARYPEPFFDPFAVLAWLAGHTRSVRLGTSVLVLPYRNPLLVARLAANVHALSGGRFVLGVGVGWSRLEFDALGLPFHRRGALTDDALGAVQAAWNTDILGANDPIPIWIGGNGAAAIRRSQRFGAGWHPLRATRAELARGVRTPGVAGLHPRIGLHLSEAPQPEHSRTLGSGSVEQVISDLDDLRRLGADTVILDPYTGNPDDTGRPHRAWQALAAVAVYWKEPRDAR